MSVEEDLHYGQGSDDLAVSVGRLMTRGTGLTREIAQEAGEALAKHGDDVARNLAETTAESGQRAIGNFAQDASEDFARHSDDVARGLEETSKGTSAVVEEVDFGEHFAKGVNGRKELRPNVQYVTDAGYRYTTDEFGRITHVEVDELLLEKGTRNNYSQRIAGREDRIVEAELAAGLDDGGHLIGTQFKGSGDIDNLVAMNRDINRSGGTWYNMEQEWKAALSEVPPKKVTVDIQPVYSGKSLRPDSFEVAFKVEGEPLQIRSIKNQIGG